VSGSRALAVAAALLAATPALAAKKPLGAGERIDLNRASVVELMRLQGVGRKKAEALVAVRARTPLRRLEDVLSVKGFSARWLERHRAHLTVGAAPPAAGSGSATTAEGHHKK
jgi:competence protein ComEA